MFHELFLSFQSDNVWQQQWNDLFAHYFLFELKQIKSKYRIARILRKRDTMGKFIDPFVFKIRIDDLPLPLWFYFLLRITSITYDLFFWFLGVF